MKSAGPLLRRFSLALVALALLAGIAFVFLRSGPLAPVRVTVSEVERGSVSPSLFGIGTVEARRAYLIGPTVAGRVLRVLVDVGERVEPGQLLAEMDPVDLDARVASLDAAIARAASTVAASDAQRRDAQARRKVAEANAKRYEELGRQEFVSSSAVEIRVQESNSAIAATQAAEANLAGARQELSRLGAERDALLKQRANVRLVAPAAGVVTARDAEPGSTVVAGQAVLKLVEPTSLWVRTRFDQGRSTGLAVGLPARIVRRSDPAVEHPGKVARLELLSDSVTEERIAQVGFDAIPAGLSVGEMAEVTLELPRAAEGPVVTNAAIARRGAETGVWVVADGGLRFQPIRVGATGLDGRVQVLEGVSAGDRVVVHAESELSARSRIRIVDSLPERAR